ncbi:MAG TPA: S8 family serine peptidase [Polyangiaceae bacterium]|nr:S8 family serine peptidase [Polyangiaceae bacterium]
MRSTALLAGASALLCALEAHAQLDVTALESEQPELVAQLQRAHPRSSLLVHHGRRSWSAPRRLLMDQARRWIGLDALEAQTQALGVASATGQGVIVGIVDGGLDFSHPDFQNADGTTRVAWYIDFTLTPLGLHPDLEAQYCADSEKPCAVLDAADIDALLDTRGLNDAHGNAVQVGLDRLGHGTHVASLAAGAGRGDSRYRGVAPEATLVIANAASADMSVSDEQVQTATQFVFDRAREMNLPVVVNLSLGGDFGPHDGTSAIEDSLTELIADQPGRAIVVAAGNSGILYEGKTGSYQGPFGIHAEVHLAHESEARVPVLIPSADSVGAGAADSALLVWIEGLGGDELAVGLEDQHGNELVAPIARGAAVSTHDGDREIAVVNQVAVPELDSGAELARAAAVVISGDFAGIRAYGIKLRGRGNAHLWTQSFGAIGQESGGPGVFFPGASRAHTITIPATAPALIAVGATVNRTHWTEREGGTARLIDFGANRLSDPDAPGFFSSEGPNLSGRLKPDILAPGMAVIGAMGSAADPIYMGLPNSLSMFALSPLCDDSSVCAVVSDFYGVAVGTSMAAPVVTGIVALMLQEHPEASHAELLHWLQAGARPSKWSDLPQAAPGVVNIPNALASAAQADEAGEPSSKSWVSFAATSIYPDARTPLNALLRVRSSADKPVDVDLKALRIEVSNGRIAAKPKRLARGLIEFSIAADDESNGRQLEIRVSAQGRLLADHRLPIALDPNAQALGESVRGGCTVSPSGLRLGTRARASGLWLFAAGALLLQRRRAAQSPRQ